jgi:hypothetical protein
MKRSNAQKKSADGRMARGGLAEWEQLGERKKEEKSRKKLDAHRPSHG